MIDGEQGQHREEEPPLKSLLCLSPHPTGPHASSGLPRYQCWSLINLITPACYCLFTSLPDQQKILPGQALCLLFTSSISPTLGAVLCKYLNEGINIGFFGDFRVIIIIHILFDPYYVPRHGQGIRDAKMNCLWLVTSKSVWCDERIN